MRRNFFVLAHLLFVKVGSTNYQETWHALKLTVWSDFLKVRPCFQGVLDTFGPQRGPLLRSLWLISIMSFPTRPDGGVGVAHLPPRLFQSAFLRVGRPGPCGLAHQPAPPSTLTPPSERVGKLMMLISQRLLSSSPLLGPNVSSTPWKHGLTLRKSDPTWRIQTSEF